MKKLLFVLWACLLSVSALGAPKTETSKGCGCDAVAMSEAYVDYLEAFLAGEPNLTEDQLDLLTVLLESHRLRANGEQLEWHKKLGNILEAQISVVFNALETEQVFLPIIEATHGMRGGSGCKSKGDGN